MKGTRGVDPARLAKAAQNLTRAQMARLIDHTAVSATASQIEITQLCDEAARYGFATVAVNPVWVSYCAKRLAGVNVGVCAFVGFPLGAQTAHIKMLEAEEACENGATEIDMVMNIGALKSGFPSFVEKEISAVVRAVRGVTVKVILETGYLDQEEKLAACQLSVRAGAAFVKTSTGFAQSGALEEDVALLRRAVGDRIGVKAAGGVRSYTDALSMILAGATRLGTSTGVEIIEEMPVI